MNMKIKEEKTYNNNPPVRDRLAQTQQIDQMAQTAQIGSKLSKIGNT